MKTAVIGGDFRSLLVALKILKKGQKVDIFCGEKELGGYLRGVNIFGYDLDLGPQYLDNFNDEDRKLIEQFGDGAELTDLTFSYSNFINGKLSKENMALPSWHNQFSDEVQLQIMAERAILAMQKSNNNLKDLTLNDHFNNVGGEILKAYQELLCKKFYKLHSTEIESSAISIIPFAGARQAVFKGEPANKLKLSLPIFDDTLAAPKSYITKALYNYYPKYGYKKFLNSIKEYFHKNGVNIFSGCFVKSINKVNNQFTINSENSINSKSYDEVICSLDERMTEKILLKTDCLTKLTNFVPQHFVYIECNAGALGNLNYIFDFDLNHISTRFTDLKYGINDRDDNKTIICAEVTPKTNQTKPNNSEIEDLKNTCFQELKEISSKMDDLKLEVFQSHLVTSNKTYRMPIPGYEDARNRINSKINNLYGNNLKVLPWMHTRKEMIDSLEIGKL